MAKKLLPVVNATPAATDDDSADVSNLLWSFAGIVGALLLWLPLAFFAAKLGVRLVPELAGAGSPEELAQRLALVPASERAWLQARVAAPQLGALIVAHAAAGVLVARFGEKTNLRTWAMIGVFTTGVAAVLSMLQSGFSIGAFVPLPIAAAAAAAGGYLTRRLSR